MDFRQLKYMLMVAEERSFSKAAQKLYIAQPSLSQYIQKLENQLGVELFDRSTSPLRLTYAGELYVETAKHILDLNMQLSQQMEDIVDFKKGRLVIGLSTFRSTYIMPMLLPSFYEKFPGIDVVLVEGTSPELYDLAVKGVTDISIMTLPINEEHFSYEPIMEEEILLALPPHHPACEKFKANEIDMKTRHKIELSSLRDEPFILLKQNQKLHQISTYLCEKAGFRPKIILETESIEAAHAFAASGMGITFIPDTIASFNRFLEHPMYFSLEEFKATRTLVVAYRKGKYISKAAKEFINLAQTVLKPHTKL
ncbi:LysR family transcriptional regulator [Candidatus Clostridium stratigraminis]|uniref:LysR family transcriptional regulator n=1 Tax=Candidatus Clostridium stratigraminis TaxID=3381661 RepID=A0ABW8T440_9CLOT